MYPTVPITINLQPPNICEPSIPRPSPTPYAPSMATTQLNGVYTMEEAWYESTGKTPRKDKQIISAKSYNILFNSGCFSRYRAADFK